MRLKETFLGTEKDIQREMRNESNRKGWNDRKMHDSDIVEEAIRESKNFREFVSALRERMEMLGE